MDPLVHAVESHLIEESSLEEFTSLESEEDQFNPRPTGFRPHQDEFEEALLNKPPRRRGRVRRSRSSSRTFTRISSRSPRPSQSRSIVLSPEKSTQPQEGAEGHAGDGGVEKKRKRSFNQHQAIIQELTKELEEKENTAFLAKEIGHQLLRQIDTLRSELGQSSKKIKELEGMIEPTVLDPQKKLIQEKAQLRLKLAQREYERFFQQSSTLTAKAEEGQEFAVAIEKPLIEPSPHSIAAINAPIGTGHGTHQDLLYAADLSDSVLVQLQTLRSCINRLQFERNQLESQLAEKQQEVEKLHTRIKDDVEEEEGREDKAWELELANQEMQARMKKLQLALSKSSLEINQLNEQLQQARDRIAYLEGREKELLAQIEKERSEHAAVLEEKEQDIQSLKDQVQQLSQALAETQETLHSVSADLAQTKSRLEQAQQQIVAMEEKEKQLNSQLEEQQASHALAAKEYEAKLDEVTTARNVALASLAAATAALALSESKVEDALKTLEEARQGAQAREAELLEAANQQQQQHEEALGQKEDEFKQKEEALMTKLKQLEEENENLTRELEQVKMQKEEELQTFNSTKRSMEDSQNQAITALQEKVNSLEAETTLKNTAIFALEEELASTKSRAEEAEAATLEAREKINQLLQDGNENSQVANSEISRCNAEIEKKQAALKDMEEKNQILTAEKDQALTELESARKELETQVQTLSEVSSMNQQQQEHKIAELLAQIAAFTLAAELAQKEAARKQSLLVEGSTQTMTSWTEQSTMTAELLEQATMTAELLGQATMTEWESVDNGTMTEQLIEQATMTEWEFADNGTMTELELNDGSCQTTEVATIDAAACTDLPSLNEQSVQTDELPSPAPAPVPIPIPVPVELPSPPKPEIKEQEIQTEEASTDVLASLLKISPFLLTPAAIALAHKNLSKTFTEVATDAPEEELREEEDKGKSSQYYSTAATQTDPQEVEVQRAVVMNPPPVPPRPATRPPTILLVRSGQAAPVLIRRAGDGQGVQAVAAESRQPSSGAPPASPDSPNIHKSVYPTAILGDLGTNVTPPAIPDMSSLRKVRSRISYSQPTSAATSQPPSQAGTMTVHNRHKSFTTDPNAPQRPEVSESRMIQAITQTMIGDHLWKYPSKNLKSNSEKKHRRFFWIHPYSKTIYWSSKAPGVDSTLRDATAKSVQLKTVRESFEPTQEEGLSLYVLLISGTDRELKLRAENEDRHMVWLRALTFLQKSAPSSSAIGGGPPRLERLSFENTQISTRGGRRNFTDPTAHVLSEAEGSGSERPFRRKRSFKPQTHRSLSTDARLLPQVFRAREDESSVMTSDTDVLNGLV